MGSMVRNRGDKTMRNDGKMMGTGGNMGARDQHVGSMGVVGDRGRVGQSLWMDWLIVIIRKVVEDIARVVGWRKTLGVWMSMKVVWHLWFVSCWNIIMRCWMMACMSHSKDCL